MKPYQPYFIASIFSIGLLITGTGCQSGAKSATAASVPAPSVSIMEVHAADVPIFAEYAAQTFARDMVEVRGRVDGYIEKRLFQVGSNVKAGDVLYVLDLRPYQAEVSKAKGDLQEAEASLEFAKRQVALVQAEADLAQAEANLLKARQDVERLQPLVKEDAAAKQDLDNALAALQANQANVNAKKANVEQTRLSTRAQIDTALAQLESRRALLRTAELNLEYATIRAPIGGLIGDTLVQVGGLVNRGSAQPLTTIVPLDPIWVRFKMSEAAYLNVVGKPNLKEERRKPLQIVLADGRVHPYPGRYQNTVNQVDPKTGTLEIQATFPNPQHTILPGQFGRVRSQVEERKNVILVPQKSVQELQGMQSVLTVGPDNKVLARSIVTGERVGERWVVLQGLKPGDRVIVEGLLKARPGSVVNPQPYHEPVTESAGK
ncbi:MAG TPA: efflux RND transporter periplasmic adaptor subunit [Bryobacteraceae bacterium]|jgi:membrane fusion protein (multidrug efflux system)|nr:efflux RND transporter periplasmic adaptor subunit [Bryobacteraceae bacterium]